VTVEAAMWWNDSYHENVLCFTNNIPQRDGGTHLAGFRGRADAAGVGLCGNSASPKGEGVADRRGCARGADLRAVGQSAGPEILVADQGQAGVLEVRPVVEGLVNDALRTWFEEHPAEARPIIGKVIQARGA
jgi:DNA gyrase subunit B